MQFAEIIAMALGSLRVNKLRSALTMLGITIGVFSVIGVMTAVSALRESIETSMSFLGANMFQISKYPSGIILNGAAWRKINARRDITYEQTTRYMRLMEGTTDVICPKLFGGGGQAVYGGRKTAPNLKYWGSNEHLLMTNQYVLDVGRNLTAEDVELGRAVVVIGPTVVNSLFPGESPIGKRIKLRTRAYTVVGTLAPKGSASGQNPDDVAIVPITRYIADFGLGRFIAIATQAPSRFEYPETLDKAITVMRLVRGLRPEEENDFEIASNDSLIAAFAKTADIVSKGSFVISGLALLAAGVGIMNIMLVSVTERTKEIGVRKSIGARKVNILLQFLIEAMAISLAGGVLGIVLGVIGGNCVALLMKASVVFPWGWAALGLIVCSVIGVGFGFYPALKAAALDPIEALRHE